MTWDEFQRAITTPFCDKGRTWLGWDSRLLRYRNIPSYDATRCEMRLRLGFPTGARFPMRVVDLSERLTASRWM